MVAVGREKHRLAAAGREKCYLVVGCWAKCLEEVLLVEQGLFVLRPFFRGVGGRWFLGGASGDLGWMLVLRPIYALQGQVMREPAHLVETVKQLALRYLLFLAQRLWHCSLTVLFAEAQLVLGWFVAEGHQPSCDERGRYAPNEATPYQVLMSLTHYPLAYLLAMLADEELLLSALVLELIALATKQVVFSVAASLHSNALMLGRLERKSPLVLLIEVKVLLATLESPVRSVGSRANAELWEMQLHDWSQKVESIEGQ